jgi:S-(hydroxymethyl)glutathione dehydrogenase/alcohol dehydrogenase
VGDRVMLNWAIPCGKCFQCQLGKENICENRGTVPDERFHYDGGALNASFGLGTMATHAMVPEAALINLDAEVPFEVAAIMGCAVMTGFGSAVNAAQVAEGSNVVVLGCGGVGLSCILGARYRKAAKVIAVDVNPARLQLASQFGATEMLLADRFDKGLLKAAEEVRRRNGGRGADYAFECTAIPELGPAPLSMVRNGGTAIGVSGIEEIVHVNMELFEWDKIYINPLYGACRPQRDFPLLIDLYRTKQLLLDAMVTRTYALEELEQAFHDMHAGINAKGVLIFD